MIINNDNKYRNFYPGAYYDAAGVKNEADSISKAANQMYQNKYVSPEVSMPRQANAGGMFNEYYNNGAASTQAYQPWNYECMQAAENYQGLYYFVQDEHDMAQAASSGQFDVEKIREDFPILKRTVNSMPLIWLDNAATTQKPMCVIDALQRYYSEYNSNVHRGAHQLSKEATQMYEEARQKAAGFIGASSRDEVVFVRGTTEAINLVASTWGMQNIHEGDEIIISEMEHHSNIVPWQRLAKRVGAQLRAIPVNKDGEICLDEYSSMFSPNTKLVAIAHVSNVLGTVNPVAKMAQIAHGSGARILVDGAQSAPHMPIDVKGMDADFFVMSGHKVYGPTGVGVLYAKKELLDSMPAYQTGGGMIKSVAIEESAFQNPPEKFEAGTVNIADAIGLGAAVDYLQKIGMHRIHEYETDLTQYLMSYMCKIPGVRVIGTAGDKTSVVSFVMRNMAPEQIAQALNRQGIATRAGYHCAQPLHRSFGLAGTARASLGLYNTYDEIDFFIKNIRRLSMR